MKESEAQRKRRWTEDSLRAKRQFDSLHKSGKMGIPSTAPSRRDTDSSTGKNKNAKTKAIHAKMGKKEAHASFLKGQKNWNEKKDKLDYNPRHQ